MFSKQRGKRSRRRSIADSETLVILSHTEDEFIRVRDRKAMNAAIMMI
jgi:hypothetical protein